MLDNCSISLSSYPSLEIPTMELTQLNAVSIALVAIYTPLLIVALLLAYRQGIGRNAGWLYLILFSTVRIVGAALDLATLSSTSTNPNISLRIGAATLQAIGLSPLTLTMLSLLSRVFGPEHGRIGRLRTPADLLRLVQLLVLAGLVLGIVGGVKTGTQVSNAASSGQPNAAAPAVPTETTAGTALMIAGYGLLALATIAAAVRAFGRQGADVATEERFESRRIVSGVAAALPFVLVRLVYAAVGTFSGDGNFKSFGIHGSQYIAYLVGMSVVMEIFAVIILEGVGLTLTRQVRG